MLDECLGDLALIENPTDSVTFGVAQAGFERITDIGGIRRLGPARRCRVRTAPRSLFRAEGKRRLILRPFYCRSCRRRSTLSIRKARQPGSRIEWKYLSRRVVLSSLLKLRYTCSQILSAPNSLGGMFEWLPATKIKWAVSREFGTPYVSQHPSDHLPSYNSAGPLHSRTLRGFESNSKHRSGRFSAYCQRKRWVFPAAKASGICRSI